MMEAWRACLAVLIVDLATGREISEKKFVVKQTDTCPDVGYFFRRDPSPNAIDPGPCFLCFCQNNGTSFCWEREQRRCDVEKFHHHRVGRESRVRRSPTGLSDIFLRDASRDFFKMSMPEECKPFESSFSDGCPPADWCIGCTICDCDANGRWDCHILSFCDGKEKKRKVKSSKALTAKKPGKRTVIKNHISKTKTTASQAKAKQNKTIRKIKTKLWVNLTTPLPPRKTVKKYVQAKPSNKTQNKPNNNKSKQALRKRIANYKPTKKPLKKRTQPRKPQQRKPQPRKPQNGKPQSRQPQPGKPQPGKPQPNSKVIPRVQTQKPGNLSKTIQRGNLRKILNANNEDTVKLGKKIVKHVMSTVQKLVMKEMNKMNATRIQRSIKDCGKAGKVKIREKRTYNVRSRKTARNKNKYKRMPTVEENSKNERHKRETLNDYVTEIENYSVIKLLPDNNVIPLETAKPEMSVSTTSSAVKTLAPSPKAEQTKYSDHSDINGTTNTDSMNIQSSTPATKQQKHTSLNLEPKINYLNVMIPVETENNISSSLMNNDTITAINPDFNDLKFTKWYIIKIKNDKKIKAVERMVLPTSIIPIANEWSSKTTEKVFPNTNYEKKDIERPYWKFRKQNLNKHVEKNLKKPSSTTVTYIKNSTDVTGLQNILQSLIKQLNKNHTVRAKTKPKVSIMKDIRRYFHKIFSKKKTGNHKMYGLGTKEDHALQILCENLGPCKINKKNKFYLKYKLKQLNRETEAILKSIGIIKGLLHLLDLPYNNKRKHLNIRPMDINKENSFKNNVQKLSTVLRDEYDIEGINTSLTDVQQTQIRYIKANTQTFIESVKKFADILNETLVIIRPTATTDRIQEYLSRKQNSKTSFQRIKKMLNKYNLVQNTFMKKMYEFINGVENKTAISTTEIIKKPRDQKAIDISKDQNIEKYSRHIIENLKKIKNLAAALSSRRKKRNVHARDDAVEYLLTLMEYLIKQRHPLNTVPANDGIDFLIDAIKNAPDVKPIRNKVLKYTTVKKSKTRKELYSNTNKEISEQLAEESYSDSHQIRHINIPNQEENQTNIKYNIIKDESYWKTKEPSEYYDDVTPKVYYTKDIPRPQSQIVYGITTESNKISVKRLQDETEKIELGKLENRLTDDNKKIEYFAGEADEDGYGDGSGNAFALPEVVNTTATTTTTTTTTAYPQDEEFLMKFTTEHPSEATVQQMAIEQSKELLINTSESQDSASIDKSDDKKLKLDWIEETFDREIREFSELNATQSTPQPRELVSSAGRIAKHGENISGLTVEIEDNQVASKNSPKNPKTEDVMLMKQMEFLNSLDYGTEKSDFEESDIKDDARSADEAFPSYF